MPPRPPKPKVQYHTGSAYHSLPLQPGPSTRKTTLRDAVPTSSAAPQEPSAKRQKVSINTHQPLDQLGKSIQTVIDLFHAAPDWTSFIQQLRHQPELPTNIGTIPHPAGLLLQRIRRSGIPVLQHTHPWTQQEKDHAITRGSHPSAKAHSEFLRDEMAAMMEQRFWIVLPYRLVKHIPALRLSPLGVIPQRDRRPRVIVDFSFSGVNQHTITVAPYEAMQFGRAFDRILHRIHHANRRFGPVFMIKVDLSDGFYRLPLSTSTLPTLGVAFPHAPHEEPLVALPLVLPMGWVASPPFFCALTETAADLANALLAQPVRLPLHPLSHSADHPNNPTQYPRPKALEPDRPTTTLPPLECLPTLSPPSLPSVATSTHPFQRRTPTTPLAYVDIYMDDFLGLAQGHPGLRNQVRSKLLYSIDQVLRPLAPTDAPSRKQPVSASKLDKGDAQWATRKTLLGWVVDTVTETVELPPHRQHRLHTILQDLTHRRRISLLAWQKALGEVRSMILAIPGGRGLFSTLYTGLTATDAANRVRIRQPMRDALLDLQWLATDLASRPTRLGEIVDTTPVATGTADASGLGMGGIWLSPDPTFPPTLWRHPFPPDIQQALVSYENPTGTITNSDLELTAQIAAQDILVHLRDCRERTTSTFTDNVATRAWHRKGSHTTFGPSAYLLRMLSLHQRFHRYRATIDYLPGPLNTLADDASRLWHLSDTALLSHFNSTYPQDKPWTLSTLRPAMHSQLITSLQCKRSEPASFLPAPNPAMPIGFAGSPTAMNLVLTPPCTTTQIQFKSSKSLPSVTDPGNCQPPTSLLALAPWRQPSAPSARRWPVWGPRIPG